MCETEINDLPVLTTILEDINCMHVNVFAVLTNLALVVLCRAKPKAVSAFFISKQIQPFDFAVHSFIFAFDLMVLITLVYL